MHISFYHIWYFYWNIAQRCQKYLKMLLPLSLFHCKYMQKLNLKLQLFEEMIELQKPIQDWIPATRYKVSHRSLVGRGLCYPYLGDMGYANILDPLPPTSPHTHTCTHTTHTTHTHTHTHTQLAGLSLLKIKIKKLKY